MDSDRPGGRRFLVAALAAFVFLGVLLVLALTLGPAQPDVALAARLAEAAARPAGHEVRLAELTDFTWERVHVFRPYSTRESIERELGFSWDGADATGIARNEGIALLVFVEDGQVVRHVVQSRASGDLAYLEGLSPFTPESAVFVVRVEDHGEPWRVLRSAGEAPGGAGEPR